MKIVYIFSEGPPAHWFEEEILADEATIICWKKLLTWYLTREVDTFLSPLEPDMF